MSNIKVFKREKRKWKTRTKICETFTLSALLMTNLNSVFFNMFKIVFFWFNCCNDSKCKCCSLQVDEDYQNWDEEDDGYSQGEDDSLSWLKEIGIQDKLRQPECINIQLYPSLLLVFATFQLKTVNTECSLTACIDKKKLRLCL